MSHPQISICGVTNPWHLLCEVLVFDVLTAFSVRLVLFVLEVLAVCCCSLLCFVVLVVPLVLVVLLAALALIPVLVKMRVSYWQL